MIGVVADCHLANHRRFGGPMVAGLNTRYHAVLGVLKAALREVGRAPLFVLGDVFDTTRPTPQEIAGLMRVLEGHETYLMVGNHDQVSDQANDHALAPLQHCAKVTVCEKPSAIETADGLVAMVPFRSGPTMEWLSDTISSIGERFDVLMLHVGIADDDANPHYAAAPDAINVRQLFDVMQRFSITHAYAGNWHTYRWWTNRTVGPSQWAVQCGALAPTGFDNPGVGFGKLSVHRNGLPPTYTQLKGGPRFFTVKWVAGYDMSDIVEIAANGGYSAYVSARCAPDHVKAASGVLTGMKREGLIADYEVRPDRAFARAAASTAARVARSSRTVDEAVAAYVAKTPLADGVDRVKVIETVRRLLTG